MIGGKALGYLDIVSGRRLVRDIAGGINQRFLRQNCLDDVATLRKRSFLLCVAIKRNIAKRMFMTNNYIVFSSVDRTQLDNANLAIHENIVACDCAMPSGDRIVSDLMLQHLVIWDF
ncbi:hypothetical protein [Massilia rubra]|uniref:Uncharacterized protein n=1 Tax=Massilia rubra TaxID=2607910 RepID=A0ABX0LL62_9BURK|nr:hypothetical protein [Massilia rubra]NHZ32987.1 hypothetical protein [Massilia rubra]